MDLQKSLTLSADHELDYYGIRSISNWKQFVSINDYDSGLAEINCDIPLSS